jgi:VIT1/CCC1 family predicted Fe2+/Mn2+ transporter
MAMNRSEDHRSHRGSWLRAAVLGANDGIVSTASLVLGVAAADANPATVALAGFAGLVGGSLSMAAGEYVSVSSQRDVEQADLARETVELADTPARELDELTEIYVQKGLSPSLAREVAIALTAGDPLAVHAREELNIDVGALARPVQAAVSSAVSFGVGAALPLVAIALAPPALRLPITLAVAVAALGLLGGWSAALGGAPVGRSVARVVVGGLLAMGLTMAIGHWFGGAVG